MARRGEYHSKAVAPNATVIEVVRTYWTTPGMSYRELARQYGLRTVTVWSWCNGVHRADAWRVAMDEVYSLGIYNTGD
jgi:uncharacterized protein YjcR